VAARLHAALGLAQPLGLLDIAFYRDDYDRKGLARDPKRSKIPFDVAGKDLLLVDDVLYTGRTVRAAVNELFDYGRPASIALVVLAERDGRQLPVCARHAGARIDVPAGMRLRLKRDERGKLSLELERAA
jgi:pyrimidine operon attenuation protein/uracil phosphoribosyltransferase